MKTHEVGFIICLRCLRKEVFMVPWATLKRAHQALLFQLPGSIVRLTSIERNMFQLSQKRKIEVV